MGLVSWRALSAGPGKRDSARSAFTRILGAAQAGDPAAAEGLLPLVLEELRKRAGHVELSP